ncbi:MAG: hypothetical protein IH576_01765 [Deltaproteobacteria bacterium]|nr:hypothetical protein [Deltaproteobacteria bacterium]
MENLESAESGVPLILGTWDTDTLDASIAGDPDNVILWTDTAAQAGQRLFGNLSVVASQTVRRNGADDPADSEDFLLDGVLRFAYYGQNFQWSPVFENLVVTPTPDNIVIPDSMTIYDGGFSVMMTTPAN